MNKGTILAVLIFAGLAAAFVALRQEPERGITRISFTDVDPAAVTKVVIEGPNPVELTKEGDLWLANGKRADAETVKRMLETIPRIESSELTTRNPERFAELEVDDDKGAHVRAEAGGKTVADFRIGKVARGGSHVRVGDGVYVAKEIYAGTFSRSPSSWLDRRLFLDEAGDVTKAEIRLAGQEPYTLVKDGEAWKLGDGAQLPEGQRFDAKAAAALVRSLAGARAMDVVDEDPGAATTGLGGDGDRLTFEVEGDEEPRVLELGKDEDDKAVYARTSAREELFTLPVSSARGLRKPLSALRDMTVMSFDPAKVERIEIADGDRRLRLAHGDGGWTVAESSEEVPDDFTVDPQLVRRRLAGLAALRATAEAGAEEKPEAGLDRPAAHVSLTVGGGETVTLALGKQTQREERDVVYARGNADDRVYLIPASARKDVLRGIDSFRVSTGPAPGFANFDPEMLKQLPPEVQEAVRKQMAQELQKKKLLEALEAKQKAK